ncbi:MAG TPA: TlpA disulfide reductase family protein [Bacteriovoracaceae bacterium]|nr:TlpA disulfide reductase family protein [Bacteriovoracaceae bacterium]
MVNRILIIVLIVAATVGYGIYQKNLLDKQLTGAERKQTVLASLPDTSFYTLDEAKFGLHDVFADGSKSLLVVHFWGTWCAPCEAELPELVAFMKRFENLQEVKFLLVAVNDELAKVQKHINSVALPNADIVWLIDNDNVHRTVFGTTRVPETFVFGKDLRTLKKYLGPQEWNKPMFFRAFDEFMQISNSKL